MIEERPRYLAYLVRLWRAGDGGEPVWRASVESPHTAERQWFADLEGLFAFLEEKTGGQTFEVKLFGGQRPPGDGQGGGE